MALLEADVALPAVRTFLQHVKAEALGEEVLKSLTPGQQVIKIVHDELVRMLGGQTGHADVPEDAEDADLAVLSDERVVAQGGEADLRSHRSVTTFTSLSATTMSRSIRLPPMATLTFELARAASLRASSAIPA